MRAQRLQHATPSDSAGLAPYMVQRACACGGSAGLNGTCADCRQNKLLGKPLQAKLRINEPGDVYEREADRVAEQVMRMPEVEVNGPRRDNGTPVVQRRATTGGTGAMEAPPIVHDVLNSPGQPLDAATRAFFESRFRHDFSTVRVHADAKAAESARQVQAEAYTVGRDIVFRSDHVASGTNTGQWLMAHELSHVVQGIANPRSQHIVQRKADISSTAKASVEQGEPQAGRKPEPPVDCTKEITPDHSCDYLIGKMSRESFEIREIDILMERMDNGESPFNMDLYVEHQRRKIEIQTKYNEMERVRAVCCPTFKVPSESPTAVPTPAPQPTEPATTGAKQ